jgi:hypothetical protein
VAPRGRHVSEESASHDTNVAVQRAISTKGTYGFCVDRAGYVIDFGRRQLTGTPTCQALYCLAS